jgi:hypothetical protein
MLQFLLYGLLLSLHVVCAGRKEWDDTDYEIFDLNDSLQKLLGKDKTFYDFLELDSTADSKSIASAYRKTSLKYHPDKNTQDKDLEIYSKLLTSIAAILKDEEGRRKYDLHLSKGFPIWRGSGYYYKKYRPGLWSVLFIVILFISNVQYWSGWGIYLMGKYIENEESTPVVSRKKKTVKRKVQIPKVTNVLLFQIPWLLSGLIVSLFRGKKSGKNE